MKTVVSFVPNALDKDSRAFKIAASIAKFGFKSIVVEAKASNSASLALFDKANIGLISSTILCENPSNIKKINNKNLDDIQKADTTVCLNNQNNIIKHFAKLIWNTAKKLGLLPLLNIIAYIEYRLKTKKEYVSQFKNKIPDPDIIYLHSYEFYSLAQKLSRKHNAPIYYDIHDFYPEINPNDQHSRLVMQWIKPYQIKIQNKLCRRADSIITVSNGLAKKCRDYFHCSEPIVIKNAHDSMLNENNNFSLLQKLNLEPGIKKLVSMGNCKEGSNILALIQALEKLPKEFHLIFIGAGYDHYYPYSSKAGLNGRLHFLNALPLDEIVPVLKQCDLGILPYFAYTYNYQYCLPNGFFQIIAAELPILFSNDVEEIVKLNQQFNFGKSVNLNDSQKLLDSIQEMLIPNVYAQFKENLDFAKKELSWEKEEMILKELLMRNL